MQKINIIKKIFIAFVVFIFCVTNYCYSAPSYLDKDKLVFMFGGGFELVDTNTIQLLDYGNSGYISKGLNFTGILSGSNPEAPDSILYELNPNVHEDFIVWSSSTDPHDTFYDYIDFDTARLNSVDGSRYLTNPFWEEIGITSVNIASLNTDGGSTNTFYLDDISITHLVAQTPEHLLGIYSDTDTNAIIYYSALETVNSTGTYYPFNIPLNVNLAPVAMGFFSDDSPPVFVGYPVYEDHNGNSEARVGINTDITPASITVSGNLNTSLLTSKYPPGLMSPSIWPGSESSPEQCFPFTVSHVTHNVLIRAVSAHNDTSDSTFLFDMYFKLYYEPEDEETTQIIYDIHGKNPSETIVSKSIVTVSAYNTTERTELNVTEFSFDTQMMVTLPADVYHWDSSLDASIELAYEVCLVIEKDSSADNNFTITNNMTELFVLALPTGNKAYDERFLDYVQDNVNASGKVYKQYNHYDDYLLENQTNTYLDSEDFAFNVPFLTKDALVLNSGTNFASIAAADNYLAFTGSTYGKDFQYATLKASRIEVDQHIYRASIHSIDDGAGENTVVFADNLSIQNAADDAQVSFKSPTNNYDQVVLQSDDGDIKFYNGVTIGDDAYLYIDDTGMFLNGMDSLSSYVTTATDGDLFYTGELSGDNVKVIYFKYGLGTQYTSFASGSESHKPSRMYDKSSEADNYFYEEMSWGEVSSGEFSVFENHDELDTSDSEVVWNLYLFATFSTAQEESTSNPYKVAPAIKSNTYNGISRVNGEKCEPGSAGNVSHCTANYLIQEGADFDSSSNDARFVNFDIMSTFTYVPADEFDLKFHATYGADNPKTAVQDDNFIFSLAGFIIAVPTYVQ